MLKKIGLIGGGNIGGVLAQEIFQRKLAATVALVDVKGPDVAKGKCLDIAEGTPIIDSDVKFEASKTYEVLKDADLIINTAGVPRTVRPDGTFPSREELLAVNLKITDAVAAAIQEYCPNAIVISIANPLDAIVFRLYQKLQPAEAHADGHGRGARLGAVPLLRGRRRPACRSTTSRRWCSAATATTWCRSAAAAASPGMPVDKFVDEATLAAIEARTRKAGGEIVGLIGVSAFWSPAIAAIEMVEAIVYDKKKIIASCVLLEGEYGVNGLFVGVPVVLGATGIERIIEVELTAAEKAAFDKSVAAVKKTADEVVAAG